MIYKMEATSRFSFVAAGIVPVIRGSVEEKVERNGRSGGEWEGEGGEEVWEGEGEEEEWEEICGRER